MCSLLRDNCEFVIFMLFFSSFPPPLFPFLSSFFSHLQKKTNDRNYKVKYNNFQKSQKRPVSILQYPLFILVFFLLHYQSLCVSPFAFLHCHFFLLSFCLSLFICFSFSLFFFTGRSP